MREHNPNRTHKDVVGDIQSLVEQSFRIGNHVILDYRLLLNLIVEIDTLLPEEYIDSQRIRRDADQYALEQRQKTERALEAAQNDAAMILEQANQQARALASTHEIARLAEERSSDMIRHAQDFAANIRAEAEQYAAEVHRSADEHYERTRQDCDEYAMALLTRLRTVTSRALASVEEGLGQMRNP